MKYFLEIENIQIFRMNFSVKNLTTFKKFVA